MDYSSEASGYTGLEWLPGKKEKSGARIFILIIRCLDS